METSNIFTGVAASSKTVTGDEPGKNTSLNENLRILYVQNCPKYLNYLELMGVLSAFGTIERIQSRYFQDCNNFYIKFLNASDAAFAHSRVNNMKIFDRYLTTSLLNCNNLLDSDDDFVPDVNFLSENAPKREERDKLIPIHNIVVVEEQHNEFKVFNFINKLIHKPHLTPETFTKFGKNAYLVKVTSNQGYMLQGAFKDYKDSGIIEINPYDEFNVSKGKIYNTNLAKLSIEDLLNICPSNVVDAYNLKTYDRVLRRLVNSPIIILKFSNRVTPDQIIIGPHRIKVKNFSPFPKTCRSCLKYGHVSSKCKAEIKLCNICTKPINDDHNFESCYEDPKCHSCESNHKTFNKSCQEFIKQQEISNIVYTEKTSYFQAKRIYNSKNQTTGQSYAAAVTVPSNQNQIKTNRSLVNSEKPALIADAGLSVNSDNSINKQQSVRRKTMITNKTENKISQNSEKTKCISEDLSMEVSTTECSVSISSSIDVSQSTEKKQTNTKNRDFSMIPINNKYSKLSVESLNEEKETTCKRKRLEHSTDPDVSKKGKSLSLSNTETSKQSSLDLLKSSSSIKPRIDKREKFIQESSSGKLPTTSSSKTKTSESNSGKSKTTNNMKTLSKTDLLKSKSSESSSGSSGRNTSNSSEKRY